jgi:hypothetical protein
MAVKALKSRMLRLLREDEEFRYAVAGLLGLEEILKRLDRHEAELVRLREDMNKLREDMNKLREDMVEGFRRHDIELARLREDMIRGFELVESHISALGARWGIMAESAFRESLRGLLEKELGYRVEKWTVFDEAGKIYGYPSLVDVDVTVSDGKLILIEVSSHIKTSDITTFKRKAELYMEKTGKRPDKLVAVTPYIDDTAQKAAKELGIEVYTKVIRNNLGLANSSHLC